MFSIPLCRSRFTSDGFLLPEGCPLTFFILHVWHCVFISPSFFERYFHWAQKVESFFFQYFKDTPCLLLTLFPWQTYCSHLRLSVHNILLPPAPAAFKIFSLLVFWCFMFFMHGSHWVPWVMDLQFAKKLGKILAMIYSNIFLTFHSLLSWEESIHMLGCLTFFLSLLRLFFSARSNVPLIESSAFFHLIPCSLSTSRSLI